jgi:hypothetical protein
VDEDGLVGINLAGFFKSSAFTACKVAANKAKSLLVWLHHHTKMMMMVHGGTTVSLAMAE